MALPATLDRRIAAIRGFNRFYTAQIGVLQNRLHDSPFALPEARLLYELGHRENLTATALGHELGLDAGYLSRLLQSLERRGFVRKLSSAEDRRQNLLSLTPAGHAALLPLEMRARDEIADLLKPLDEKRQRALLAAMTAIETSLRPELPATRRTGFLLRPHRVGDLGWVASRHGALYAEEYGWNGEFEAFVARLVARFITHFDPAREGCWIAEVDGEPVGSAFLVRHSETIAQLRMLFVEPRARGLGIGKALVDQCIRFARQNGYRKVVLWTNRGLHAARHLYEAAGFRLLAEERHRSFGKKLVGQNWELDFRASSRPSAKAKKRRRLKRRRG
ncbi:MAG TPA: helix-turn-helix domain-containing GNAT family N-acetyltransferase [Kofleriaceae bacterium]|nr:helix-turn-helix domain-containing GNAT family N-acetyltransferase [Kofleriaceae bacterium]